MISHKNNSRMKQQRAIIDFYHVLADLTEKQGYSGLTVSEIVAHSGYNRATFYKYFKNKEELAASFVKYVCQDFYQICRYPFQDKEQLNFKRMKPHDLIVFPYIMKHAHYFKLLNGEDTIPNLSSSILETIIAINNELHFTNYHDSSPNFKTNVIYKAYGFYGLVLEWVKSDFQISPILLTQDLITILAADNSKADIQC